MSSANKSSYQFGPFFLDGKERLLLRDGQQITITPKAFETLLLLVENSGHVLTKEEMLTRLWPDTFVEEANLTNNISILRKALGDSNGQQYIKTVPRVGYRFVAPLKPLDAFTTSERKEQGLSKRRRIIFTAVTVACLLLITGGWIILARHSRASKAALPFNQRDWILIARFDNRTGEPLFDGTIESALERELSNSRFVNVITSERAGDVLRLMKKPPETKIDAALGREVCLRDGGTRALITGRIEKLGTTYVMSVNLVDPFHDQTVASASEETKNQESLWPAIRRLSNWTRETLGEALPVIQQSNESLEKVTTPSLRALQLYTQAMPLINQYQWGPAEQVLKQAVAEDPEFASAYIMLAHAIRNQDKPEKEWGPPSRRAYELSERTSEREQYFIQGSYYGRFITEPQYEKAASAYEALIRQYPDYFWGQWNLAWTYNSLCRWPEMVVQYAKAADLRPNDLVSNRMAAWNLMQQDMAEASRIVQRADKLITPELTASSPYPVAWIQLFAVHDLWVRGETESALRELDRWAKTVDSRVGSERETYAMYVGNCYLAFGKLKAAEEFFQKLPEDDKDRNLFLAEAASAAGDELKSRKYLNKLFSSWRWEAAFSPGLTTALWLARAGLTDEAIKVLSDEKKKQGFNALNHQVFMRIVEGEIALSRGHSAEAISLLQDALPTIRWNDTSVFFLESVSLADALDRQGDPQKSVKVLEETSQQKAIAYEGTGSTGQYWLRVQWRLAQLYRKLGRAEEAEKVEAELLKMLAYADPEHPILRQLKFKESSTRLMNSAAFAIRN